MRSASGGSRAEPERSFSLGALRATIMGPGRDLQARSEVQSSPWQPMRGGRSGPLVVAVQVNGVLLDAMIDSGATRTAINSRVADRLRLKSSGRISLAGMTGDLDCERTRPVSISVGAIRLPPMVAIVLDLDAIAAAARTPFDLILGQDMFLQHEVEFDFENGRFRLVAPRRGFDDLGEADDRRLALQRTDDGLFCTDVALGETSGAAALDLGSMVPLYIDRAFAAAHGLTDPQRTSTAMTMGVEGIAVHTVGRLPRLSVAGSSFTDVPFAIPDRWNLQVPVVLGLPLLSRFDLRLAFKARWAKFEPRAIDEPFPRDRSGINVVAAGDRMNIVHVAPNSPAALLGIVVGDAIVSVDGAPVDALHRGLGAAPAGTAYALVMADGRRPTLELADYY